MKAREGRPGSGLLLVVGSPYLVRVVRQRFVNDRRAYRRLIAAVDKIDDGAKYAHADKADNQRRHQRDDEVVHRCGKEMTQQKERAERNYQSEYRHLVFSPKC